MSGNTASAVDEDFKPHYFRLRGTEETSELLFNSQGEPKFPFYWTKNPNRLRALKESSLTDLELLDVKLLTSFHPVDCNVLIEKEGDAGALQPYIVEMSIQKEGFVPQMDAKAIKAFSRTNKRKQGSQASGPVHIAETEHELLEAAEEKLLAEQSGCKEDANHSKAEITFQYEQGFEKAIDQVKFLHPEIIIDEVGAFKEIRDGKLVDIPGDEE
ncbi:hypothetical protein SESBI_00748 [Sesbania bispinosa]|nr:hypothetical protein SESBI_00748 [Sesbania bispinosa]